MLNISQQILLTFATKTSKAVLGRMGLFTVSSLHVLVLARSSGSSGSRLSLHHQLLSTFDVPSTASRRLDSNFINVGVTTNVYD